MPGSAGARIAKAQPGKQRLVPCICPRQFEAKPPIGLSQSVSKAREITVERVKCSACHRTWRRVNA